MNFDTLYYACFWDKEGDLLARLPQTTEPGRIWISFALPQPLRDVWRVSFEYEDGSPAYVRDALQFGAEDAL